MVIKIVQFKHSKLVQPNTIHSLNGENPYAFISDLFPYVVPAGFWIGILDMDLGSKFTDGGPGARASMLVLNNMATVPDNVGIKSYRVPLVAPPGVTLTADLINNDAEQQWMTSTINGILVPKIEGQDWREAFAFLFQPAGHPVAPIRVEMPRMTGTIDLSPNLTS